MIWFRQGLSRLRQKFATDRLRLRHLVTGWKGRGAYAVHEPGKTSSADLVSQRADAPQPWKALLYCVLAIMFLIIIILAIWQIPLLQATSWEGVIDAKDMAKLVNDARGTVVQAIGGAVLLIGLFFTWWNLTNTQATATRNLAIAEDGQITDRFTSAIQQLGSNQIEIRLGGIYALERIARDSARDHWTIMEILTAFLRTHARWQEEPETQLPTPDSDEKSLDSILADNRRHSRIGQQEGLRTDIQAILTVLGRRLWTRESEHQRLDLSRLDLRGALLIDAFLKDAIFIETHLEGAQLLRVHCEGANFAEACFEAAPPRSKAATLIGVHMDGANLSYACLRGIDLSHVDGLTRGQIRQATTDDETILPDYLNENSPRC